MFIKNLKFGDSKIYGPFFRKDPLILLFSYSEQVYLLSLTSVICISFMHHDVNTFASDNRCGLFMTIK